MNGIVAEGIEVSYGRGRRKVRALNHVSVAVQRGNSLGIVGESGSGKSTLGRVIAGLLEPDSGTVDLDGTPLASMPRTGPGSLSRVRQMIFQDPNSSLNQRMPAGAMIREALVVNGIECDPKEEMVRLLDLVGLPATAADSYPFELSGGQRQRIAIARALAAQPRFLICDEITSALDVSVQSAILRLLRDIRDQNELTLAFITHNLDIVRALCDEVIVLQDGHIVEAGPTSDVFDHPQDLYTRSLLDAVPRFPWRPFSVAAAD
ncbi:ABC-type glutathione transport system ATPase component [Kibdelosporangium banguiense]|uniref:ABC-type glutathione transport system ATPase component n=1 Tax=Kibdelosporangium banguiense TaxID=1365924 RepID=A0ABS4TX31_9PSEU|nr:ABC transporter ATP-binding protein [Kibdelosporangium banguiense]MBP2328960.1 ABC-type glutathione transport system ATPase component [Kibdelosporangium banguiense]